MTDFVAHRGRTYNSKALENTVESFEEAFANPSITGVELDIQETKDHELVLMNYDNFSFLFDEDPNTRKISNYTWEELSLKSIKMNMSDIVQACKETEGNTDHYAMMIMSYYLKRSLNAESFRIPRLDDILALDRNGKKIFIEVKGIIPEEDTEKINSYASLIASKVNSYDKTGITFIGRDVNVLSKLKELCPEINCLPVIGYNDVEKVLAGLDGVASAFNHLDKNVPGTDQTLVDYVVQNGQLLNVWNVRTPEQYAKLRQLVGEAYLNMSITGDFADLLPEFESAYEEQRRKNGM